MGSIASVSTKVNLPILINVIMIIAKKPLCDHFGVDGHYFIFVARILANP